MLTKVKNGVMLILNFQVKFEAVDFDSNFCFMAKTFGSTKGLRKLSIILIVNKKYISLCIGGRIASWDIITKILARAFAS